MNENKLTIGLTPYEEPNPEEFIEIVRSPLAKYNEELVKQFGFLDTQGLALDDDDNENGRVHIDQLYILPDVSIDRISPESIASSEIDGKKEAADKRVKITDVLKSTPRLALLGDPGIGKTTLVQWLICSLCHISDTYAKQSFGNMFPLLATARKISPNISNEPNINGFIDSIIKSQGTSLAQHLISNHSEEILEKLFSLGQVILILDGLDEVSVEVRSWLCTNIKILLEKYPKTRLLITSRVVGFNNDTLWGLPGKTKAIDTDKSSLSLEKEDNSTVSENSEEPFGSDIEPTNILEEDNLTETASNISKYNLTHVYYLAPFSPNQRLAFARNWLNNYIPHNNDKREEFLKGVHAVSKHSLQLNALSRIPVLLNLICFILYRRGKLPNGRAELYQRIVETYLVTMDKVRRINKELSEEYDYNDIKSWLSKLALQMQAGTQLNIDKSIIYTLPHKELYKYREEIPEINNNGERLLQVSEKELKDFFSIQLTEAVELSTVEEHSEQLINYIKNRTGFLIPKGQLSDLEVYGFSHLSFQEYFCAYAIVRILPKLIQKHDSGQSILYTVSSPSWSEIWQLVFEEVSSGVASRQDIEEFLNVLFPEEQIIKPYRASSITTGLPVEVNLYAKLVTNPAIKLSKSSRLDRQLNLIKGYLTTDYREEKFLNELLQLLMKEEKSFCQVFENVEYLCLTKRGITDFSFLRKLHNLNSICFHISNMNDLELLSHLENLKTLYLGNTKVIDLKPLKKHKSLEHLYLHHTKVSDLRPLRSNVALNDLTIGNSNVKSIKSLKSLSRLERLHLDKLKIETFEPLGALTSLKKLNLESSNIKCLKVLEKMTQLEELGLAFTDISDLGPLSNLKNLKTLTLIGCNYISLEQLEKLPKLQELYLPRDFDIHRAALSHISENLNFV